ncbi:MAG: Cof-type HAD-IIB family hydrolase [Bacteroidales bacterium]|jgi:Cof subfamily protein (haloacid dehalogenase superfamily)|nr:Cof-type HAD-IIB family hydrolase [Bacteroidales bacterium]
MDTLASYISNRIKIVFFDIDGTLVGLKSQKMTPATMAALEALKSKGIIRCIATGRHALDTAALNLPDFDAYIYTNGASCVIENQLMYKKLIPKDDIDRLVHYLQGDDRFPCVIETADNTYLNYEDPFVIQLQNDLVIRHPVVLPFEQWIEKAGEGVEQLLCFVPHSFDSRMINEILPGCMTKRWCPYFTDVIEKSCDKLHGIRTVLKHYGFKKSEAMSFGDGGNDIQMLQGCGIGVAMGSAAKHVHDAACFVTAPADGDGILKALRYYGVL